MCAIDDADRYTVYHEATRRARKQHKCDECRRLIEPGETYRCTSGLSEGHWTINRVCAHCTVATNWLQAECGGYLDGGVQEDIEEHAAEYRQAALWRLVIGMRRKWRAFKADALMALPKTPAVST